MSIWAYVGLPGGGKSYHAVSDQIYPALQQGRTVVTNIPVNDAALSALGVTGTLVQVTNDELEKDAGAVIREKFVAGAVIVLDELWRVLPQGKQAKDVDGEWKSLFAEHRHRVDAENRSMQIVLVTQDLGLVAAFARALVERTVLITKLSVVGANSSYRVDVYAGCVTGLKPPVSKRVSTEYGKYDPKIFALYQSHTMSEAGAAGKVDESGMSDRGTVWRNPAVRYGVPIGLILLIYGVYSVFDFFTADRDLQARISGASSAVRGFSSAPVRAVVPVGRVSAVLRASDDYESRVLLESAPGSGGRWLPWHLAGCMDHVDGSIWCEYQGQRFEFTHDWAARRASARSGNGEMVRSAFDDLRSRLPVSSDSGAVDGGGG